MNKSFEDYINKVITNIGITGKKSRQIKEDLYVSLLEKQKETGENDPYMLLGDHQEIADDFRENLGIKDDMITIRLNKRSLEYVSKTKILGIPLVHASANPCKVAKGIFSFGLVSTGIFSFGALSFGVFSFGGLALGLLTAIGGISLSSLLSIGGIAVAYKIAIGGLAIAKQIAVGGYSRGDIAIGGVAHGIVSVFKQNGTGKYLFNYPANPDEVINSIKQVYPKMGDTLLKIIKSFL